MTAPHSTASSPVPAHEMDLQVVGENRVADQIRNAEEARRRDHHWADGEPVETVGQVHRIAGADDDEHAEDRKEVAEVDDHLLEHRQRQRRGEIRPTEARDRDASGDRDHRFEGEPERAGKTGRGLARDLQIIVIEADQAETERHREHDPDVGVARIGPQHRRHHDAAKDHQPAHGRRTGLADEMRLWPVAADRLALALPQPQMIDDPRAEQEYEDQRRQQRAAGSHREITEDVEDRERAGQIGQPIKHRINLRRTPLRARLAKNIAVSAL